MNNLTKAAKATKKAAKKAATIKATTKAATKPKQVLYLKQGITGKQHQLAKRNGNKAAKAEIHSMSFCIKMVLKHCKRFLGECRYVSMKDITPAKLDQFKTDREKSWKAGVWLVATCIDRMNKERCKAANGETDSNPSLEAVAEITKAAKKAA